MTARAASGSPGAITLAASPRAAIISPVVDALCTGGLSLLVLVPLLVLGRSDLLLLSAGVQAWLGALVNMPHFLASYRMVYQTRASIRAHPWAAVYVPILLLSCCIAAVVASRWTDAPVSALLTISSTYLALHYTGQAWGMIVTFTYLDGASFNPLERRLVRGSLYILMAWHVVWFFHFGYRDYFDLTPVYEGLTLLTAVALAMGLTGSRCTRPEPAALRRSARGFPGSPFSSGTRPWPGWACRHSSSCRSRTRCSISSSRCASR
ncbi:MAG: hypothetical protein ACREMM_08155 [Gemmatimonadales bacterium]